MQNQIKGGGGSTMRYVILEGGVSSNVTFCYDRGGGGRKIPISALRKLWTASNEFGDMKFLVLEPLKGFKLPQNP